MPKINVPGGALYYKVYGDPVPGPGVPMVMLRGLGRSIRHWLGFEEKMAKHFQVICVDARGIGRSTAEVPWLLSLPDMAADIIRVMDKLNLPTTHIFGVSLGGMIAMSMGVNHGDRVQSLSIVNSSIGGYPLFQGKARISRAAVMTILQGLGTSGRLHDQLAELLTGSAATPSHKKSLAQRWAKIEEQEGRPISTVVKQIGAAMRFRNQAELGRIKTPSLIISGLSDKFVPPVQSEVIHRLIPNSQIVRIQSGGHEITDDCPEEVLSAVLEFVGSNKSKS